MINAFGTSDWGGYSAQVGNIMATAGQWDNMIAYQTPSFAGFKIYAQYGMGNQVTETVKGEDVTYGDENESSSDRYYAIGATYNNGPFSAYSAVDSINYSSVHAEGDPYDQDDSLTVTLGGSYDFEVVKVYLGSQYFDEVKATGFGGVINNIGMSHVNAVTDKDKVKGYAVSLTGDAPLWGGKAMFGVAYMDAESADSFEDFHAQESFDFKRYVVSVGYDYPFSKRTDVYAVASYMQDKVETSQGNTIENYSVDADPSAYTFYVGLRHKF